MNKNIKLNIISLKNCKERRNALLQRCQQKCSCTLWDETIKNARFRATNAMTDIIFEELDKNDNIINTFSSIDLFKTNNNTTSTFNDYLKNNTKYKIYDKNDPEFYIYYRFNPETSIVKESRKRHLKPGEFGCA